MTEIPIEEQGFVEAARFYRFRTPYVPKFFADLATQLGLSPDSVILDIACGDGQLAAGLAPYVDKAFAVDASAEMLGQAKEVDNVEYVQCDLNTNFFVCEPKAQHAFIGRAIPYLPVDKLRQTLELSVLSAGKVLVCGSLFARETPWVREYLALRSSYGPRNLQDLFGESKLNSIGYEKVGRIVSSAHVSVTEEYIVGNALAYGSSANNILARLVQFRRELQEILAPHFVNGKLNVEIGSWAYVYSRKIQGARSR